MKTLAVKSLFAVFTFVIFLGQNALAEDATAKKEEMKVGSTLENLQTAYNGESNAHARYMAFAVKADEEGYGQVASLFRATAKSEEIHANNHAKVIKSLKAEPESDIKPPEVKSTLENIKAALEGESYERDVMYPAFIKKAQEENLGAAVRSFKQAAAVEAEHAKYYSEVSANPEAWKQGHKVFLVCTDCGLTTTDLDLKKCPVCSAPRKDFVDVK